MPERIRKLPVHRGFPVPWFVAKVDGEFDFRIVDRVKFWNALRFGLCWVCGEKLGKYKSFVIGPMCGINRTAAEPPSHRDCARFSAQHCPFLSRPNMKRREDEVTRAFEGNVSGIAIKRNPGASAVWTVESYTLFPDGMGGVLIEVGDPTEIEWFAHGRPATRAEILESIDSGIHHLRAMCDMEESPQLVLEAHEELDARRVQLERLLPP